MKVLLVCYAGMSTSLLVSKIQKKVKEENLDYTFEAIGTGDFDDYIEDNEVDYILLGPQARHMLKEISERIEGQDIPIKVIDSTVYGRLDVDGVFNMLK